ncbi:alpha/beta hydrolase [Paenibacillus sp. p3-SID867]|uniref:alpha/beta fold hydrolase n=1 Tax=Paenibacillus sp. p3-SID867 TaxID=2916363 RepID=UPI0021A83AC6|nr:alpha/beta hydrolase [Paenibacillus sp. p3-SID867]MCT1402464.1 alpha/beta hydrolase [Paenibacillus sp. p3-SID867]
MNIQSTVMSEGFAMNVSIRGNGRPILVVGSSIYYPRLFSEQLYTSFQLIFLDHSGFVKPPRTLEPEEYTLDKVLDDIEAARQTLELEDFIILGHSGHAFMALEYAKKYPEHVRKVVLLNTAPTNSPERQQQSFAFFNETACPERKRKFEADIALLEGDIQREPNRRFAHMCIRMGAHSFYDYAYDAAWMWEGVFTNMPVIDHLWGEAFARLNLIDSLKGVTKPVFLGLGRYDYLVSPVSLWDAINGSQANVKKVIFEKCGHNPMFEEPDLFNALLTDWIHETDN